MANSPESNTYYWRDTSLNELSGGDDRWQLARDRKQLTAAATYFKDNLLGGNHNFKFGGEMLLETGYEGCLQSGDGHSSTASATTLRRVSSSISRPRQKLKASVRGRTT
ncbi:MAG TPA: hypothetical protein VHJ77_16070 [Vicinamibacterales bacterium]|nr:hypothetical protein [Vicinamibacterales bacterium]